MHYSHEEQVYSAGHRLPCSVFRSSLLKGSGDRLRREILPDVVHRRRRTNHHWRRGCRCDNCRRWWSDDSHFRRRRSRNVDVIHGSRCDAKCRLLDRHCCRLSYGDLLWNNNKRGCNDRHVGEIKQGTGWRKKGKTNEVTSCEEMPLNATLLRHQNASPTNLASRSRS